jgi:hypothetical protein
MRTLITAAVTTAVILASLVTGVFSDMLRTELRTRLSQLPEALIRLAARRIPAAQRADLRREWLAEAHRMVRGTREDLPVSSLARVFWYAVSVAFSSRAIARELAGPAAIRGAARNRPLPGRKWRALTFSAAGVLSVAAAAVALASLPQVITPAGRASARQQHMHDAGNSQGYSNYGGGGPGGSIPLGATSPGTAAPKPGVDP